MAWRLKLFPSPISPQKNKPLLRNGASDPRIRIAVIVVAFGSMVYAGLVYILLALAFALAFVASDLAIVRFSRRQTDLRSRTSEAATVRGIYTGPARNKNRERNALDEAYVVRGIGRMNTTLSPAVAFVMNTIGLAGSLLLLFLRFFGGFGNM